MSKTINVAQDFSRYPAGRFVADGPYSGEHFRQRYLVPALSGEDKIFIELDGTRGYGSSFLEEAFGGLVRLGFPKELLSEKLELLASNASLKYEIFDYIKKAQSDTN